MGLPVRLEPVVPAAPAAPVRAAPALQTVVDEPQVRRRVALHDVLVLRIVTTQRADAADVPVEPLVRNFAEVGARAVSIKDVTSNPAPGRRRVARAVRGRWRDDVEQPRKLPADPWTCIVLVRDRVDPHLGHEGRKLGRRTALAYIA